MKSILAAAAIATAIAGGSATASPAVLPVATPEATVPAVGSLFADLAALGYDLGKFRPDYAGRFPYR